VSGWLECNCNNNNKIDKQWQATFQDALFMIPVSTVKMEMITDSYLIFGGAL